MCLINFAAFSLIALTVVVNAFHATFEPITSTTSLHASFTALVSESAVKTDDLPSVDQEDDDSAALSCFGTKEYWDDVYNGMGDFPSTEYSWYYDWNVLKRFVGAFLSKEDSIFLPGIGNDPLLSDLVAEGYKALTAQDYCASAIDRQLDLLETVNHSGEATIDLSVSDVKRLPPHMAQSFDRILEKGLLDAVYLSGPGNVEKAVASLCRTLKPGGIFISVSGVIPSHTRRLLFSDFEWLRDGENDLQAGCFIMQKQTG